MVTLDRDVPTVGSPNEEGRGIEEGKVLVESVIENQYWLSNSTVSREFLIDVNDALHSLIVIESIIDEYDLILMISYGYQIFKLNSIYHRCPFFDTFYSLAPSISHHVLTELRICNYHISAELIEAQYFTLIYKTVSCECICKEISLGKSEFSENTSLYLDIETI
jgi:hypothetical protein